MQQNINMGYKSLFFILFLFTCVLTQAQTGIGTITPDASAKLEVASSNKGFLPPRVALTATNSSSPINNPANGLMVFNTVTAGANPFQVVPGYYYWDGVGLKWVSLSTTVGNVQNQAIFRSTANTAYGTAVSTWNARFNNIASGDLTVTSNTTFALSNGIYKIQWGLPAEQTNTYNTMQLQEYNGTVWNAWSNDAFLASVANGGGTDWGGATFMTDIVDCSSSTKTFRLINNDGARTLYYGASFIITKLNPSITTSTTADNLGNHTATKNLVLSGNYISNDGSNEGIRIDNNGNVGIGNIAPSQALDVSGNINASGNITASIISGTLSGTANKATALSTARTISATGDIAFTSGAFDGTSNVTGVATLANSGVTAGTYGSSSAIPAITVDAKGRITAISTNVAAGGASSKAYFFNNANDTYMSNVYQNSYNYSLSTWIPYVGATLSTNSSGFTRVDSYTLKNTTGRTIVVRVDVSNLYSSSNSTTNSMSPIIYYIVNGTNVASYKYGYNVQANNYGHVLNHAVVLTLNNNDTIGYSIGIAGGWQINLINNYFSIKEL